VHWLRTRSVWLRRRAPPRPDLRIEALAAHHDRDAFSCGVESLDRYLSAQAGQAVRRRVNGVFILVVAHAVETVLGYYTLCATSLPQGAIPAAARKHVPRYPLVSATLIGRLAISRARQGDGLGSILLADAVRRAYASAETVGSSMLVVDTLDERAAAFYESFGFQALPESLRLVLPMRSIEGLLAR
jgi:GNAT superfamily N-acetyltransferase